jgi:hypothetical protein
VGLFKNIRQGAKAVSGIVAEARAMAEAAQPDVPLTILNPSTQEEVDRLIAAGGVARGVVVRAHHPPQHGERASRMRVTVHVRSRLKDGALGESVELKIWTSWKVAALLDPGLEIPIVLDRNTGLATEIPTDQLRQELEARFDESEQRSPGWVVDPDLKAAIDLPGDVKDFIRSRRKGGGSSSDGS